MMDPGKTKLLYVNKQRHETWLNTRKKALLDSEMVPREKLNLLDIYFNKFIDNEVETE